jgi:hypothetical protein
MDKGELIISALPSDWLPEGGGGGGGGGGGEVKPYKSSYQISYQSRSHAALQPAAQFSQFS